MRIFIGIPFSQSTKDSLNYLQSQWTPFWSHYRLTQSDNFHITLCFIGDLSYEQVTSLSSPLHQLANEFHPFQIEWNGIDQFEKNNTSIVYSPITKGSRTLSLLSSRIKTILTHLGIPFDKSPYKAHITLARMVRWITPQTSFPIESKSENETLTCFQLFESTRVNDILAYVPLETYSFKTEAPHHD